jgi:hypothetical protein
MPEESREVRRVKTGQDGYRQHERVRQVPFGRLLSAGVNGGSYHRAATGRVDIEGVNPSHSQIACRCRHCVRDIVEFDVHKNPSISARRKLHG